MTKRHESGRPSQPATGPETDLFPAAAPQTSQRRASGQATGQDRGNTPPAAPLKHPEWPVLTEGELQDFIQHHHWKEASSAKYKSAPHSYTLRERCRDDREFDRVVMHIRNFGFQKSFGRTIYTYLQIGEWFYWTMGWPVNETILINRARNVT